MARTSVVSKGGASLYPILSVNFVGTLGFSIVLPFLVFLVTRWGGNALIYGIIGATYSLFQMIGAPILGRWSDSVGRRKILLVSQIGTLLSWGIFFAAFFLPDSALVQFEHSPLGAFTLTLPLIVLFIARAADGLTGGNISVATAYMADISTDADRNANFGKLAVSSNLGFIFGPMLAGLLAGTMLGERLPVMAAIVISLVAAIMIARLPETLPCVIDRDVGQTGLRRVLGGETKPCYAVKSSERLSVAKMMAMPGIPLVLGVYFLVMLGFNFFYVAFPMYAVEGVRWTVGETGVFFGVLSAMMAFVQGPILSRAARRWSDVTLVIGGSFLLALGFLCFMGGGTAIIYTGAALVAVGNGVMWPSVVAILSKRAGPVYQGAVQGFASSCGAAASILGLIVGGVFFDRLGAQVFAISAVLIFLVFVLSFGLGAGPRPAPTPARA